MIRRRPGRTSGGRPWGPSGHTNRRSVGRPDASPSRDRQAIAEAPTPEQERYAAKARLNMGSFDSMPPGWRGLIHEFNIEIFDTAIRTPGLAGLGTVHDIPIEKLRAKCEEIRDRERRFRESGVRVDKL